MRIACKLMPMCAAAMVLAACSSPTGPEATSPADAPLPTPRPINLPEQPPYKPQTHFIVNIANFPVAMAVAPDERIFYTEKSGAVRVTGGESGGQREPVISLPTDSAGERGMIGIAVDPGFEENHYVWVYHTAPMDENPNRSESRVVRFTEQDGIGIDPQVALRVPIPRDSATLHVGGNLHFGPDGMLYLTIGDFFNDRDAQKLDNPAGKMHRFVPDVPLGIPDDNPFPDSSVYALGLRNSFDFTFDPVSGSLFATENGPDCDDEINLILAGYNYGWGEGYQCGSIAERNVYPDAPLMEPLAAFTPTIAITGAVFYQGDQFPEWQDKLLFCAWNTGSMSLATLNEARDAIDDIQQIDLGDTFCRTDLIIGPKGEVIYTSADRIYVMHGPLLTLDMAGFEVGGQTSGISEDNVELFEQSGMRWVKLRAQWSPEARGWDASDRVEAARQAGFKVLLTITGPPNPNAIDFDGVVRYMSEAANLQPEAIEVWNGVNLESEWPTGQISADNYVQNMLRPAYEAIKDVNPNIMVISSGISPTGAFGGDCSDGGCDDDLYIRDMVAARAEEYLDCVGVVFNAGATSPSATTGHPFDGGDAHHSWYYSRTAALYSSVFSRPLCFTGLGYISPEGHAELPAAFAWGADITVDEQADWLSEALQLAQDAGNVRLAIVFNMDLEQFSPDDPQAAYAILRPDGSCPACEAIGSALR